MKGNGNVGLEKMTMGRCNSILQILERGPLQKVKILHFQIMQEEKKLRIPVLGRQVVENLLSSKSSLIL